MNILEIINRMNTGGVITTEEYNFWVENYDAAIHPWMDPTAHYDIMDFSDIDHDLGYETYEACCDSDTCICIDDEMADELAYDAANFEIAMEACNAFDIMDAPTDDGSWIGR